MDHAERMQLATKLTKLILHSYPETLAVGVCGSTAKGEDRKHSDLEMSVISRDTPPFRNYFIVSSGVVVEVEVRSILEAEKEVSEVSWLWPMTADQWVHLLPTHDPEHIFQRLGKRAAHPPREKLEKSMGFALVLAYHNLCKMRNFSSSNETALLRYMASSVADRIALFVGLLNGRYYNGIRNLITLSNSFEKLPEHFRKDFVPLISVSSSTPVLMNHAERLFSECKELFRALGLHLPSEEDLQAALRVVREAT